MKDNYLLVGDVKDYRKAVNFLTPEDVVIEVGTSTGETTKRLAKTVKWVHSIERNGVYEQVKDRLIAAHRNLALYHEEAVDFAWRMKTHHCGDPDAIFIDVGGSAMVHSVIQVVETYQRFFMPRVFVVRSIKLMDFYNTFKPWKR